MKQNEKTARAGFPSGLLENLESTDYGLSDFVKNVSNFTQELQSHLARHRTVRRMAWCIGCKKPKNPLRMSPLLSICKDCMAALASKGKVARNNFIERAKSNFGAYLRRGITNVELVPRGQGGRRR